ncbi:RRQRL motif-containing zinc-binding protein [Actinomadura opuntiae]|uniref:RRQRL motif-containing zinc-binding protein n=1 Tax=Actinomadura sp. OS1-43 TaxID=604315 RepID=UPI00255A75DF|nr:RRQRL motif-containing zinc-binding protein [Actinomadura sp. OS1-43]MDL4817377.1 RRQRL motif-containing zinc-binding protein [Actinomadura sp. OS1-43]
MSRIRAKFFDPYGKRYGIPTYPWQMAPSHLRTYRQLAEAGLRPGGQGVQAQVMWKSSWARRTGGVRVAYLYDVARALPKRRPSPAQLEALAKALKARRLCPRCGQDRGYVLRTGLGCCEECATPWELEVV